MTPSLLALLQHPAEARRAFAAEYASLLGTQASGVVVSALLSSDSCLSTLLKRLSGDDKPASRSHYARLIACCAEHQACDAAVLKKISDSGAVPYLLRLLKEIEGSDQKFRVVYCLEVIPPTNSVHLITLCVCVCMMPQLLEFSQSVLLIFIPVQICISHLVVAFTHSSDLPADLLCPFSWMIYVAVM